MDEGVKQGSLSPGNTNLGEWLSTIDLLINVVCFVKKGKYYFQYKMS